MKHFFKYFPGLAFFLIVGCEDTDKAKADFNYLKSARSKIEMLVPKSPSQLSADEKVLLEQYFKMIAYWIQYGEKSVKDTQKRFSLPKNMSCSDVFINRNDWRNISQYCEIEGLYLCPEEMKKYGELLDRAEQLVLECQGAW
jgi:hypothetical protein